MELFHQRWLDIGHFCILLAGRQRRFKVDSTSVGWNDVSIVTILIRYLSLLNLFTIWCGVLKFVTKSAITYGTIHMRQTKTQISLCIRAVWSVFVVHMKILCILGYPKCAQRRFWSDCTFAQSDQNLRWAHIPESTFSDVTVQVSNREDSDQTVLWALSWLTVRMFWWYEWYKTYIREVTSKLFLVHFCVR